MKVSRSIQFSSVQSLSRVRLFVTPWTAGHQASLSITNSRSLPKLMSIESVIPSNHLILCCPLLLLPSIFPSIRVFSNKSGLHIRWPKYWSFRFSFSPSNEQLGPISFRMDWFDLLAYPDIRARHRRKCLRLSRPEIRAMSMWSGPSMKKPPLRRLQALPMREPARW